jgi:membrane protease YdiL (CAAX protease family)
MKRIAYTNRELILNSLFILACIFLVLIFPGIKGLTQIFVVFGSFFVLAPILYIKFILKKPLGAFGFRIGEWRQGIIWAIIGWVIASLILFIFIRYTDFLTLNKIFLAVGKNFWGFVFYELVFVGIITLIFEIFFRGVVLQMFAEKFGWGAIFIQFAICLAFLFLSFLANNRWEAVEFIIVAFTGSLAAYWGRSPLYSFVANWLFFVLADALIIRFFVR